MSVMTAGEKAWKTRRKNSTDEEISERASEAAIKAWKTIRNRNKLEERAVAMLSRGMSVAKIAARLKVSTSFIYTIRNMYHSG